MGGGSVLYSSSDGGVKWSAISTGFSDFKKMHFVSQNVGFVIGYNGLIIKTEDKGLTWAQKSTGTNKELIAIDFKNEKEGIVVGVDGIILKTSDGGETWKEFPTLIDDIDNLYSVSFNGDKLILAAGIHGELIISSNDGVKWKRIRQGTMQNLNAIQMINEKIGWVVGDGGIILRSTNGGTNWILFDSLTSVNLNKILFITDSIGWIVGDSGKVFKTLNGGQNWVFVDQFNNINIYSLSFIDSENGWVSGMGGAIFQTTDGGNFWIQQQSDIGEDLSSIFFIDKINGWSTSDSNVIICTTDGGNFWEMAYDGFEDFFKIHFINADTGWIAGGYSPSNVEDIGVIFHTNDGGLNWQGYSFYWGYYFYDVYFFNSSVGWIFGRVLAYGGQLRKGVVAYTIDGGENLTFLRTSTANPLFSASIINETKIWTVGAYGSILKNDSAYIITSITENEIVNIANYQLSQNYPNPFNPTTVISYHLPASGFVTLKVYDILGREVVALVSEEKAAGEYEVEFSGDNLSTGIIFIN